MKKPTKIFRSFVAAGLFLTSSLGLQATDITVATPSFEGGESDFKTTNNANDISITTSDLGKWVSRDRSGQEVGYYYEDITSVAIGGSGNSYVQDGSQSVVIKENSSRGVALLVDVTSYDMTSGALTLSSVFSGRGTGGDATMKMRGYNDLTGLTVDIGGDYSFTGGTEAFDYGETSIAWADIDGQSDTFTLSGTSSTDFDYLTIILGAQSTTDDLDTNWVAFDDVGLSLVPEPSAFALLAGCFGFFFVMMRRRV